MKKVKILISVIFIIALTGCLWMACEGGGGADGGVDNNEPGFDGGKSPAVITPEKGFIPVTNIIYTSGAIFYGATEGTITLKGQVLPWDASYKNSDIVWSIIKKQNASSNSAVDNDEYISIAGNVLTVKSDFDREFVKVRATIVNGGKDRQTYAQDINVPFVDESDFVAATDILLDKPIPYKMEVSDAGEGDDTPLGTTWYVIGSPGTQPTNTIVVWSITQINGSTAATVVPDQIAIDPFTAAFHATKYQVQNRPDADAFQITATIINGSTTTAPLTKTFGGGIATASTAITVKPKNANIAVTDIVIPDTVVPKSNTAGTIAAYPITTGVTLKPLNATKKVSDVSWSFYDANPPESLQITADGTMSTRTAGSATTYQVVNRARLSPDNVDSIGLKAIIAGVFTSGSIPVKIKTEPEWIPVVFGTSSTSGTAAGGSAGTTFTVDVSIPTVGPLNATVDRPIVWVFNPPLLETPGLGWNISGTTGTITITRGTTASSLPNIETADQTIVITPTIMGGGASRGVDAKAGTVAAIFAKTNP